MSIIQVDSRPMPKILVRNTRLSWQQKFRRNIYQSNYSRILYNVNSYSQLEQEEKKNQSVLELIKFIKERKNKGYQHKREFYDAQIIQSQYSPYSVFIPIESESYMSDQIINTFAFISNLWDTAKRLEKEKHYQAIHDFFKAAKIKGLEYAQQQWPKVKNRYLCQLDTLQAITLLIELTRKDSKIFDQLYGRYGRGCLKQVFFYRVSKTSMYIRSSLKMHKNLKISMQVGQQINQKTLPLTMKTWYCTLCMCYDCQKHKLEYKVMDYKYEYISMKNKKMEIEHIQQIIKLLKYYQSIKEESILQQQKQNIFDSGITSIGGCSQDCYRYLKKQQIPKLNGSRHKLISPLAKSLLKLGIQIFSYNPCQIVYLFQSKGMRTNINCNLIFLHFVEEGNLMELINNKMNKNQIQFLRNQDSKQININIKSQINKQKVKKNIYLEKRQKNQNPEFAVCMHNFIGHPTIDSRCSDCVCRQRGFCMPACLCGQNCQIQRIGCLCKGIDMCQTDKCLCFVNKVECQPGVCGECFTNKHQPKKNNCRNDQILREMHKHVIIGVSLITGAGLGAFAGENYNKNELVCKYSGEHICSDVDYIREAMIKDLSFYNFDSPNGKIINASIDARFMGNKARFINHGNDGQYNLRSETISSNGTEYIALYASRDIKEGEELLFNYDGNGVLYAQHRDKYPFIKAPVKKNL